MSFNSLELIRHVLHVNKLIAVFLFEGVLMSTIQMVHQQLNVWYQQPYGVYVQDWLNQRLTPLLSNIFGATAARYGVSPCEWMESNRIPFQFGINSYSRSSESWLETEEAFWPLPFNSLDLIVMPHALEYAQDPYALMRAAVDSLNHEGFILFVMINPHSPWRRRRQAKWVRQMFSAKALFKDLRVLGLELVESRFGCYCPVFESAPQFEKYRWLDAAGDRWCGHFGGVYYLLAKKRTWAEKWVGRLQFQKQMPVLKPVAARSMVEPKYFEGRHNDEVR